VPEVLRRERLAERALQLGERVEAGLRDLHQRYEVIGDVRGHGLLWGVELVTDRRSRRPHPELGVQMLARCTAPDSTEADDMQVVLVSHLDLTPFPALLEQAGVPVVALINVALMRPRGHGRLSLASTDPGVQPRIELNFCADREDLRRLVAGTRLAWQIATAAPMLQETERIVGLTEDIVRSDELLGAYVLDNVGTYCHALGSASMGPDGDSGAVVDQYCRLRGIENLWVVDASVIPTIPRVPLNLTAIAIGERVADWLRF
jgi:choline dehydrogenase